MENVIVWDGDCETANEFIGERFGVDWVYLKDSASIYIDPNCINLECNVGDWIVKDTKGKITVKKNIEL